MNPVERVQKALTALGYGQGITYSELTIFTVSDAAKAVGVTEGEILKSLIFLIDGSPWLVLMSGSNKVHSGAVKRASGGKKVSMAPSDYVLEHFGYAVGGVPPVGYDEQLPALLDEDLWNYPAVWAAAGTDHHFFPISPDDLARYTGGRRAALKKTDAPQK